MKKLSYVFYITITLLLGFSTSAFSQFEGEIRFQVEDYTGRTSANPSFRLTSADDRMFIFSDREVEMITGFKADGLLIRNDKQDFVFNTSNNQSLKITKSDLDGLLQMIERYGGAPDQTNADRFDWKTGIVETGNTKSHLGYELMEFRVKGDREDQYASVWLTEEIKMNWGLMTDVWKKVGNRFSETDLPVELVMNANSFPLLFEVFDRGNLLFKIESVSVETSAFDRSVLQLPEDRSLIGITDVMMNMFRQQR
ncbi:MAG: hypothetical protein GVY08_15885 [Bacteroidetes bacterium]|jgi:hypothetical protein|nr:hypothetical protein [Bacteroidota bacterium]